MAYIGQEPLVEFSSIPTKDSFTGDGSTVAFDMSAAVVSAADNALAFEESMEDLMDEYEDVLQSVNFVVDIERVKKDITKRTKIFMKKRK